MNQYHHYTFYLNEGTTVKVDIWKAETKFKLPPAQICSILAICRDKCMWGWDGWVCMLFIHIKGQWTKPWGAWEACFRLSEIITPEWASSSRTTSKLHWCKHKHLHSVSDCDLLSAPASSDLMGVTLSQLPLGEKRDTPWTMPSSVQG